MELKTPVKYIKRVGERIAAGLAERGVVTVEDLLYHLPFRYEDRLHPKPLSVYQAGDVASIIGEVRGTVLLRTRSGPIFEMTVGVKPPVEAGEELDGLLRPPPLAVLETVKCLWFHGSYLQGKFKPGQMVALYGKLEGSRSGAALNAPPGSTKFKMVQPTFEILPDASATGEDAEFTMLEMGRIVPVYPSLGGTTAWGAKLTSRWLRRVMWTVFKDLQESEAFSDAGAEESLPKAMLQRLGLPGRMEALQALHFPAAGTSMTELMSARTPAHRRLIFEEFWYLELGLELKRRRLREREGTAFVTDDKVREALKQVLPFKPTAAQKRVLGEIAGDMRKTQPMRRLLQGDVGSGKTIVAFQAAVVAIENGYQAAMMAPTEILATQHYLGARKLLKDVISPRTGRPYRVALLTGSLDDRTKREVRGRIFRGEVDLAIGTHALVEEKVDFDNLGLVIVDEQHRFGVQQRFRLMRKPGASGVATEPDVLVMTATPIPRTLALTMYGDLEASVIDELPPGRSPIVTRRVNEDGVSKVWEFVRKQVEAERQAYIVYPVIEGERDDQPELDFALEASEAGTQEADSSAALRNDKGRGKGKSLEGKSRKKAQRQKLRSATEMFEELSAGALKGLKLGLLHGRMSADDKEVMMARFKRGEVDVLVSTTVIEVGVDVPNATVMVIEHADRFGLAQMHQLRGRVGRGAAKSYCVLVTSGVVSPEAEQRLDAMVRTQNGFELAEFDLQQRGPGEFFGTRQAGLPEFRVANLTRDREILELAKSEAERFVESRDPSISQEELDAVWARLKQQWQRRYGLVEA
ncbi:ATP-dependent DNA helicase RecG [Granulicella sp. 5B5]|uniref:ATP-dependent DNA helicase RecG n=1 Tax=Granulicella sp. 5B5 TaxID=1617967 RepID=UPI0015F4E9E0|nr:ATP-dependent DNA helicase RecG [Granulicella sp. 5B5]QMV19450.1 ATP-dependent DNA helicase RecG [Granulicella sp. 5B5]